MPLERARTSELATELPDEGETIFVIGNPLKLEGSVSDGIVSAVVRSSDGLKSLRSRFTQLFSSACHLVYDLAQGVEPLLPNLRHYPTPSSVVIPNLFRDPFLLTHRRGRRRNGP